MLLLNPVNFEKYLRQNFLTAKTSRSPTNQRLNRK
jgi:hypothetical protein